MTTRNGRHRPGDPAAAARPGVAAPVRPVVAGRRSLRDRAGLLAVAVVAIVVVAAGIGLGGRGTEPAPRNSASTAPSPTATSRHPTVFPVLTVPPPAETPGFGCMLFSLRVLPEIRLWATTGEAAPVRGVPGPPDRALSSPPTGAWPVPNRAAALILDQAATIVLVPDGRACIRSAVAEYLAVDDLGGSPVAFALGETTFNPPRPRVVLGTPPRGDWIVRVVASYSTGLAGNEDQAVIERFFRVTSGLGAEATPLVSPAVACARLPPGAPAPRLYLAAGEAEPVLGVDVETYPGDILNNGAIVTATFPERLEVRVAGDACATSWRIQFLDPLNGAVDMLQTAQDNPGENPYSISQNRIELPETLLGRSVVLATVSFGSNRFTRAAWELSLSGPPVPAAEVIRPDGDRAEARPGCVAWTAAGRSAFVVCDRSPLPGTLGVLTVPIGSAVRIDVPGWQLTSWNVSCGTRSSRANGGFEPLSGCSLGSGGDGTGPAGPALFLPFPGRTIVVAWISARRAGDTVSAPYYVEILAEP